MSGQPNTGNPMNDPIVTINWCAADVQELRHEWSDDQCIQFLEALGERLKEASIEHGWEVLHLLISHWKDGREYWTK